MNIILIGGAEGTGKSTLAEQLSKHLDIPWFSTDQVRTILQTTMPEEEKADSVKNIAKIWEGVVALANRPFPWENGCIIEGVGILPELVARDLKENPAVKAIFLIQQDQEKITEIISERSKLPWIKTKTEEQQKEKVDALTASNKKLSEDAEKFGFPCVVAHTEKTFNAIVNFV